MKLYEITDDRPLVWQLAAQQLAKGKRVIYYVAVFIHKTYTIGPIVNIFNDHATVRRAGSKELVSIMFHEDDDTNLTIRPSNDLSIGDFIVINIK